jgi:hypothetical protein
MNNGKGAVEMTVHGRKGKPRTGFPLRPQPLEIAKPISTFPPPLKSSGKVENQNQVSHFPPAVFPILSGPKQKPRKEAWRRSFAPSPGSLFD